MIAGAVPTRITQGIDVLGVRVRLPASERAVIPDVAALRIRAPGGAQIPLSRIATIERISGKPQITRENMKRMVAVTAPIEGRDMGTAVADVRTLLRSDASLVPAPLYWELGGLYKEQQASFLGLAMVFGAGTILVLLLILYLYERFAIALTLLLVQMPLVLILMPTVSLALTRLSAGPTSQQAQ